MDSHPALVSVLHGAGQDMAQGDGVDRFLILWLRFSVMFTGSWAVYAASDSVWVTIIWWLGLVVLYWKQDQSIPKSRGYKRKEKP